jgi:hypothetical protein
MGDDRPCSHRRLGGEEVLVAVGTAERVYEKPVSPYNSA